MTIKRLFALLFLTAAVSTQAQTNPFDVEAGYRWLDLKGNSGMYRTQINEREGFLIRSFTLNTSSPALGDRIVATASDFGTSPAGSIRIEAGRRDVYRFTLGYRTADQYDIFP